MSPLRLASRRAPAYIGTSMMSVSAFQRRLSLRLAAWSAASLAGGAALIQALNILEGFPQAESGRGGPETIDA